MMIVALLILVSIVILGVLVVNAPEGYEDEEGFHYGERDK